MQTISAIRSHTLKINFRWMLRLGKCVDLLLVAIIKAFGEVNEKLVRDDLVHSFSHEARIDFHFLIEITSLRCLFLRGIVETPLVISFHSGWWKAKTSSVQWNCFSGLLTQKCFLRWIGFYRDSQILFILILDLEEFGRGGHMGVAVFFLGVH